MFVARHSLTDESTTLINHALAALVDAAGVFPSIIRTDLHACLLQIFVTILSTPSTQSLVVPQVLPIFRRFVASLSASYNPDHPMQEETQAQLRSTLDRFLLIVKNAQKREFEAAPQCEKNTVLASTILLSSAANVLDPSDPLLARFIDELVDCLGNRVTSKVAANCCRSLLLLPKRSAGGDAAKSPDHSEAAATATALSKLLLPHLIPFLTHPTALEGLDESRTLVAHSLTLLPSTLPPPSIPSAVALVLPSLLARAKSEGSPVWRETADRLVELAGIDGTAFRGVVTGLQPDVRAFMEEVVRSGQSAKAREEGAGSEEDVRVGQPTIELKMDFAA